MSSKSMKEDLKYEVPTQAGRVRMARRGDALTVGSSS